MPANAPQPVFRFAPSPNGRLHLGHAYSALLNERMAHDSGGRLLLRIEDVDRQRSRTGFEAGIFEDLDWLGVAFDGAVRRQSEHAAEHEAALERLLAMGLAYRSSASRSAIAALSAANADWPRDPDGALQAPPREDHLHRTGDGDSFGDGAPAALRLDLRAASRHAGALSWREDETTVPCRPELWGDPVLKSRDGSFAYHLAVVVCDAAQGVTHVVRGADLREATTIHRVLQAALGLAAPRYHHHRLVLDGDGQKLAKSRASPALCQLRAEGVTARDIRTRLGFRV
jgi:glutamyl-Q tRNA(Asp) synthetase